MRRFRIQYSASVESPHAKLWLPVPQSDAYQQIDSLNIDAPHRLTKDGRGNQIAFVEGRAALTLACNVVRHERRLDRLDGAGLHVSAPPDLARHLEPERLVPLDSKIRGWAAEVTQGTGNDLEKARAIYNHVVATVKYDKSGQGWGRGDIYYACDARRGNCSDFHAIFIGYCRAVGVPARFAIGFPLPRGRRSGRIDGYHCWAEFYARGIGWVPVDASEAAKDPSRREYFFGAHDESRVEFSRGRDIRLAPAQHGDPLNFFVYPYAEAADGRVVQAKLEVSFEDLA